MFFSNKWDIDFIDRVNIGLIANSCTPLLNNEILAYRQFECLCHFYGTSPTGLVDPDLSGAYATPIMQANRFLQIQRALGSKHPTEFSNSSSFQWEAKKQSPKQLERLAHYQDWCLI